MIDEKLVALAKQTKKNLAKAKGGRRSAKLAVQESFAEQFIGILDAADHDITDAQKIAVYDQLFKSRVKVLRDSVSDALNGKGYHDSDEDSYQVLLEVQQALFGAKIFDATSGLEPLLPPRDDDTEENST